MAVVTMEGFDLSRFNEPGLGMTNGSLTWITGRTGGKAMQLWYNAGEIGLLHTMPQALTGLTVHMALNIGGGAPVWPLQVIRLRNGSTSVLSLGWNADKTLSLIAAGTVLGTTALPIELRDVWNHIEMRATIGANGSARLKVNGATLLELTGVNTAAGGAQVTNVYTVFPDQGSGRYLRVDDYVLLDHTGPAPFNDGLGDVKIETLRPNATGASSDWVGSDGNSVDNWALVDDDATTTDYVSAVSAGARDLYNLTDPTGVDLGDILALQVSMLAAKSDAGDPVGRLQAVMRSVGGAETVDTMAEHAQMATTYQWFRGPIKTTDPAGDPWTVARVNGLQIGPQIETP